MIKKTNLFLYVVCSAFLFYGCGTTERSTHTSNKNPSPEKADNIIFSEPDSVSNSNDPDTPATKVLVSPADEEGIIVERIERGQASWYGPNFHGRLTANGERFDMHQMTAAHRTLPFNTMVWVKNKDTGKSVQVRINDRGPFAKNRIIDLSKRAARKIGMVGPGTANVELYVAKKSLDKSQSSNLAIPTYTVQLGSYKTEAKAFNHSSKVAGSRVEIIQKNDRTVYRVYYGLYLDKNKAYQKQQELVRKDFSGFVKQIEN